MPDAVAPEQVSNALGIDNITASPAMPRDAGSLWILSPRPVQLRRLRIVPAASAAEAGALRLVDGPAFGTGLHPTTALCLGMLDDIVPATSPETVLDVGTGSGVLALAALVMGVPRALGIDLDEEALRVAAENARLNGLDDRLRLARGGPADIAGNWFFPEFPRRSSRTSIRRTPGWACAASASHRAGAGSHSCFRHPGERSPLHLKLTTVPSGLVTIAVLRVPRNVSRYSTSGPRITFSPLT
jgi:hypothetical protein